jgi:hypothetical protein
MTRHAGRDPSTAVDLCAYGAQRSILAQDDSGENRNRNSHPALVVAFQASLRDAVVDLGQGPASELAGYFQLSLRDKRLIR